MPIVFNVPGMVMAVAAAFLASGLAQQQQDMRYWIAGPVLAAVADLVFRLWRRPRSRPCSCHAPKSNLVEWKFSDLVFPPGSATIHHAYCRYRVVGRSQRLEYWFHPGRGGSLYYLPVWLIGVGVLLVAGFAGAPTAAACFGAAGGLAALITCLLVWDAAHGDDPESKQLVFREFGDGQVAVEDLPLEVVAAMLKASSAAAGSAAGSAAGDEQTAADASEPAESPAAADAAPWICPACGEENPAGFETCWRCASVEVEGDTADNDPAGETSPESESDDYPRRDDGATAAERPAAVEAPHDRFTLSDASGLPWRGALAATAVLALVAVAGGTLWFQWQNRRANAGQAREGFAEVAGQLERGDYAGCRQTLQRVRAQVDASQNGETADEWERLRAEVGLAENTKQAREGFVEVSGQLARADYSGCRETLRRLRAHVGASPNDELAAQWKHVSTEVGLAEAEHLLEQGESDGCGRALDGVQTLVESRAAGQASLQLRGQYARLGLRLAATLLRKQQYVACQDRLARVSTFLEDAGGPEPRAEWRRLNDEAAAQAPGAAAAALAEMERLVRTVAGSYIEVSVGDNAMVTSSRDGSSKPKCVFNVNLGNRSAERIVAVRLKGGAIVLDGSDRLWAKYWDRSGAPPHPSMFRNRIEIDKVIEVAILPGGDAKCKLETPLASATFVSFGPGAFHCDLAAVEAYAGPRNAAEAKRFFEWKAKYDNACKTGLSGTLTTYASACERLCAGGAISK